jgi:3-oxoacyl-[acyl-carrier-protein] synthase III
MVSPSRLATTNPAGFAGNASNFPPFRDTTLVDSIGLAMSLSRTRPFNLIGSGAYIPRTVVGSHELDALAARRPGSTRERFKINSRHYAAPDETSSMMATAAAEMALQDAGCTAGHLDAILGACGVMEQPIPGTAPLVQRRLGLGGSGIPAFDINATCLSFLPALDAALAGMVVQGWRRVLIFSADIASAALDHDDAESSAIFGDGAAAVILEQGDAHASLAGSRHMATMPSSAGSRRAVRGCAPTRTSQGSSPRPSSGWTDRRCSERRRGAFRPFLRGCSRRRT